MSPKPYAGSSALSNQKTGYIHRLSLFHRTSVENAEKIISSQEFKLGGGLYSNGVYFANTIEATKLKTLHHNNQNSKWTVLVADVYIGKYISISKDEAVKNKYDSNTLKSLGFNTIFGYKMITGKEIVCLDESRIHNIKYAFGEKPRTNKDSELLKRPRVTLFVYVTAKIAKIIHQTQSLKETNGPFGKAIYLYDNMTDARDEYQKGETFMACDANIEKLYEMKNNESLRSNNVCNNGYKAFYGKHQGRKYFFFTDPRLVSCFHYCGGTPW